MTTRNSGFRSWGLLLLSFLQYILTAPIKKIWKFHCRVTLLCEITSTVCRDSGICRIPDCKFVPGVWASLCLDYLYLLVTEARFCEEMHALVVVNFAFLFRILCPEFRLSLEFKSLVKSRWIPDLCGGIESRREGKGSRQQSCSPRRLCWRDAKHLTRQSYTQISETCVAPKQVQQFAMCAT